MITDEKFSVAAFYKNGTHEYTAKAVSVEPAVTEAKRLTMLPEATTGETVRVIITDSDDCTVFEWKYGEGVVWPPLGPK